MGLWQGKGAVKLKSDSQAYNMLLQQSSGPTTDPSEPRVLDSETFADLCLQAESPEGVPAGFGPHSIP